MKNQFLRGSKKKYKKIHETIYELNNTEGHKKGKLDSIRQEKVKKLNESLRDSQIKNMSISHRDNIDISNISDGNDDDKIVPKILNLKSNSEKYNQNIWNGDNNNINTFT